MIVPPFEMFINYMHVKIRGFSCMLKITFFFSLQKKRDFIPNKEGTRED